MTLRLPLFLAGLMLASTLVHAEDVYLRKAGLWQLRITDDPGSPPMLADMCLGKDTDARLAESGRAQNRTMCSQIDAHRSGDEYIVDSVCDLGIGTRARTHRVTTKVGEDAYRVVARIHYDRPLPGGKSDATNTIEGNWVGACPADMKPGDQIMRPSPEAKEVMRVNVLDKMSR